MVEDFKKIINGIFNDFNSGTICLIITTNNDLHINYT